jgi:hypothetical protein
MRSAVQIASPDADLIAKVAARMESPHDAEALTAARMTVARLDNLGLKIADVLRQGVVSCQLRVAPSCMPHAVSPLRPHQRSAMEVRACGLDLSDWESRFLKSMWEQRSEPSPRQKEILADLVKRVRENRA